MTYPKLLSGRPLNVGNVDEGVALGREIFRVPGYKLQAMIDGQGGLECVRQLPALSIAKFSRHVRIALGEGQMLKFIHEGPGLIKAGTIRFGKNFGAGDERHQTLLPMAGNEGHRFGYSVQMVDENDRVEEESQGR